MMQNVLRSRVPLNAADIQHTQSSQPQIPHGTIHCTYLDGFRYQDVDVASFSMGRILGDLIRTNPLSASHLTSNERGHFREMLLSCSSCGKDLDGSIIWWLQWIPSSSDDEGGPSVTSKLPSPGSNKKRALSTDQEAELKYPCGYACIISHAGRVFNWEKVRRTVLPMVVTPEKCIYVPVMGGSALDRAMQESERAVVMHQFCVACISVKTAEMVQRFCSRIV